MEHANNKKTRSRAFIWVLLVVSLCVLAFSGFMLWSSGREDRAADNGYTRFAQIARPSGVPYLRDETAGGMPQTDAEDEIYIPQMDIDFDALRMLCPDAVSWLYCPDTAIDYPVVKAPDYEYYLHRLPDKTRNSNGSLFIDYNCLPDFSDDLTVIYGHHMRSGAMFGSLKEYNSQSYFEQHPYMYLYTDSWSCRIDLMYGFTIGADSWTGNAFMLPENAPALIKYASENTAIKSPVQLEDGDRVVALSTCSYDFDDARFVVLGVLRG